MAFPTTVLPLPQDNIFSGQLGLQEAYDRLCVYETGHPAPISNPLPARWLGHLLREAPRKEALTREITCCADDAAIEALSVYYRDRFLRVCAYTSVALGPLPEPCTSVKAAAAPSDYPSRPSFDVMQKLNAVLQDSDVPPDHDEAKRRVCQSYLLWSMPM